MTGSVSSGLSGFDDSGAVPPSLQAGLVETADELDSTSKEGGSRSVAMETRTDRLGTDGSGLCSFVQRR